MDSDVGSIIFLSDFGILLVTGYLLLAKLSLWNNILSGLWIWGFSDAVTETKLKTIKLRKYVCNVSAIKLKPKAHFDLSVPSLEFAKSSFATDTHVKRLDSFGHLQLCGYSHITRKGFPAGWITISVRCTFESGPAWRWHWTGKPPSISSNLNLFSKTISNL